MKFSASERTMQGTGASRRLRNAGLVPGIVYGAEDKPQAITLNHNELWQAIRKEAFHASILDMDLDGKTSKVLLRDLQMHPFKRQILHADFQRVSEKQEIHMDIPLHFTGEEESNAIKREGCLVDYILNEIEIRCLPSNLPERITVDLSQLEEGDTVTAADLSLPEGVALALRGREAEDIVIASIFMPTEEVEEDLEAVASAEGEAAETAGAEAGEGGDEATGEAAEGNTEDKG